MKILFLAPEPFFQERGTPIAVRLALQVLAGRKQDHIDLLTYHEGTTLDIPGVSIRRIRMPSWVKGIGPGLSLGKLFCDVVFFFTVLSMVWRARREPYHIVHAVEESVFIAWLIRLIWGIPYIYDMDSSLALQVTEKWFLLKPLQPLLEVFEKYAVKHSLAVVPVCDALAVIAKRHGSRHTQILSDISLLDRGAQSPANISLRDEAGLAMDDCILLYMGNLERYQGVELLVRSFARIAAGCPKAQLVIIGGRSEHCQAYAALAVSLNIQKQVHLLGPRPVEHLSYYLRQADILVSPRIQGNNTPMKIYSYLHSGVAVLATRLFTHTQVLDETIAALAEPDEESFSSAMKELIENPALRRKIGQAAQALAQEKYTFERFQVTLNNLYDRMAGEVRAG